MAWKPSRGTLTTFLMDEAGDAIGCCLRHKPMPRRAAQGPEIAQTGQCQKGGADSSPNVRANGDKDEGAALERAIMDGTDRPDPAWERGVCPACGGPLVAMTRFVGGRGYRITRECWNSLGARPTCDYRREL